MNLLNLNEYMSVMLFCVAKSVNINHQASPRNYIYHLIESFIYSFSEADHVCRNNRSIMTTN